MNDDMDHMNHIDNIAGGDMTVLRSKEATYRGSWKRAGGRSAWFMMRRNMDRLITMMAQPEKPDDFSIVNVVEVEAVVQAARNGERTLSAGDLGVVRRNLEYLRASNVAEDIFAKIEEKPDGSDGTVLACVRDLRRYLTLIEAEMVSRGVVQIEASAPAQEYPGLKFPTLERARPGKRGRVEHSITVRNESATVQPGTPEDGGHHARQEQDQPRVTDGPSYSPPWIVDEKFFTTIAERAGLLVASTWYEQRAKIVYRVEAVVESSAHMPRELSGYYDRMVNNEVWLLKIDRLPPYLREEFPSLQREMNSFEFEFSPEQFRFMYQSDDTGKYILQPYFAAWGRE